MLLILLSLLSLAGPVEQARAQLDGHARGRSVEPLKSAAAEIMAAQARAEAPRDGPTWDLIASLHLVVAQDGSPTERAQAVRAAIDAAYASHGKGGAPELTGTVTGIAMLATDALRRARTDEDRQIWRPLGQRLHGLCLSLDEPPPATVCGQLAQALAPLFLDQAATAAELAQRAASLGHPSKRVDLRVTEAFARAGEPEAGLAFAEAALARWPGTWELHDLAGGMAARLRRFEAAEPHFSQALEHVHPELTRQRAVLLRKRAAARSELGRLDAAISDFEAAEALAPADPTQRYLWGRAHVLSARGITNETRKKTGNKAALPARAQEHCRLALPHLQSVVGDARLGAPAGQALALCQQVIAATPTGE